MPELMSFKGLQAKKKPSGPLKPKVDPRKPVFGSDHSSDEDDGAQGGVFASSKATKLGVKVKPSLLSKRSEETRAGTETDTRAVASEGRGLALQKPKQQQQQQQQQQQMSLSARHTFNKNASAAQELDPSVYEYDAVFDSLHAKPAKSSSSAAGKSPNDEDDNSGGPKYMNALLAAAEVRKRDQLRARDTALTRERAAEGAEFADKEAFVTGAYKTQQAELRRAEAEEEQREAAERARRARDGGGMTGMYKDMLGRADERHAAAMRATEDARRAMKERQQQQGNDEGGVGGRDGSGAVGNGKEEGETKSREQLEMEEERELALRTGATLNEDGQVVDKRQLLSAGLNVVKKTRADGGDESDEERRRRRKRREQQERDANRDQAARPGTSKQAMRERQSRMLEQQLEEASKRAAADEDVEKEAVERANKRRTTEKDVSSAKERYLARKKAAEAAKNSSKD